MTTPLPSFKLIDAFAAIAQDGSIEHAAKRLRAKPTTVSQQLKLLEVQLGVELFDRGTRPMQLTKRGELFLANALEVRQRYRLAVNNLYPSTRPVLQNLSLAIIDDFNSNLTPRLATALSQVLPETRVKIYSGRSDRALDLMNSRKVDAAITAEFSNQNSELKCVGLVKEKLVLIHARSTLDPDLSGPSLVEALNKTPYVAYEPESPLGRLTLQHLQRLRLTPNSQCVFDNNRSVFEMVRSLGGWAITTPLNLTENTSDTAQFVVRDLPFTGISRTLWFLYSDELSTIASGVQGMSLETYLMALAISELRTNIVPQILSRHTALDHHCLELLEA